MTMRILSKSKLLAFRQCAKRLWLEVNQPQLRNDSIATQASFVAGHQVGDVARQIYDPKGCGVLIDPQAEGFDAAFERTRQLLQTPQPIFEAGFRAAGALAFADVMLPVKRGGQMRWRMVEVKSATSVKDYHRDDAAVQALLAQESGVSLAGIALAHIDSGWVYPGGGQYQGLLVEQDLTREVEGRGKEVRGWIAAAQKTLRSSQAPRIHTGLQCCDPYECGFIGHCQSQEPQAQQPIQWLPGLSPKRRSQAEAQGITELRDVPDDWLTDRQRRVKSVTLSGRVYFDQAAAARALAAHPLPTYFLDFETISFVVPIWKGTRPYQQIPFQFSLHRLSRTGKLAHTPFLDLTGADPSRRLAQALLAVCGERGPIFVYNAGFETGRIRELAARFPALSRGLLALNERIVDLLPIARDHYYHPDQQGSWSIKAVLPTLCPDLDYERLDGVQDGGMAQAAFQEAIAPQTGVARREQLERKLLAYCELDTHAMVRLWAAFTGRSWEN